MREGGGAIRVFVSSTFRDFDAERDALRLVERALRDRLRDRGLSATLVDLRWGIFTDAAEGDREVEVLGVCLEEVERTRPYFLGLVGDRYGWVPDPFLARAAARRAGFTGEVAGRSVTELEIAHGVLDVPAQAERATFLCRSFDGAPPAGFTEPPGSEAERRLAALRRAIEDRGLPMRQYTATVTADGGLDLGSFASDALDAVWALVEPDLADLAPSAAAPHEAFAAERLQAFHGRDLVVDDLVASTRVPGPPSVVVGAPGAGASAVLAAVHRRLTAEGTTSLFHTCSLGRDGDARDLVGRLADVVAPDARPGPDTGLAAAFDLVALAAADRTDPVVLCIDALHDGHTAAETTLAWLPDPLPAWLRVVATSRGWVDGRRVPRGLPRFDEEAAAATLRDRFAARSKAVPDDVVATLLAHRNGEEPAHATPLWTALAADLLSALDGVDFRLAHDRGGDPEAAIARLVSDTARALPGTVVALYGVVLDRARRHVDPDLLDAAMAAIALSRDGLPPEELATVVEALGRPRPTPLDVARLRWALGGQLLEVGALGEIDVAHDQLAAVVLDGMSRADRAATHRQIGRALLTLDTPHARATTAWHLLRGDDLGLLADLLADTSPEAATRRRAAAQHLALSDRVADESLWAALVGHRPESPEVALFVLEHVCGGSVVPPTTQAMISTVTLAALERAVSGPAFASDPVARSRLLGRAYGAMADITDRASLDPSYAVGYRRAALDALDTGLAVDPSEPELRRAVADAVLAVATDESTAGRLDDAAAGAQRHVDLLAPLAAEPDPYAHLVLAGLARRRGRDDEADDHLTLALANATRRLATGPPDGAAALSAARAHEMMADRAEGAGDLADAREHLTAGHRLMVEALRVDPFSPVALAYHASLGRRLGRRAAEDGRVADAHGFFLSALASAQRHLWVQPDWLTVDEVVRCAPLVDAFRVPAELRPSDLAAGVEPALGYVDVPDPRFEPGHTWVIEQLAHRLLHAGPDSARQIAIVGAMTDLVVHVLSEGGWRDLTLAYIVLEGLVADLPPSPEAAAMAAHVTRGMAAVDAWLEAPG